MLRAEVLDQVPDEVPSEVPDRVRAKLQTKYRTKFQTMAEEKEELEAVPSVLADALKRQVLAVQDYAKLSFESISNAFTPPFSWADTLGQMDVIGVGSLPIIVLTGFFIGGVLVLQTAAQFERFGETALTGDAVALALVRELGPAITALLVAGRNASGIASEIGSMVVTEQVDAMRALGTDPIRKLMTPRVLATVAMLPLLTAVSDFVGLIGGFLVAYFTLRLGAVQFWTRAIHALDFGDLVQGFTKPFIFAFIISTVACFMGLRVKGGTQGVGRATTSAVVISSVILLVTDTFITRMLLWIFQK
jgi:phospholipid/cholesterol/gamma-HCH transport system permease protein